MKITYLPEERGDEADEWGPHGGERSCRIQLSERERERGAGQGQLRLFATRRHAGTFTWHAVKTIVFGKLVRFHLSPLVDM